jgi:UDP-hydrolysing UDP-N-acetyl-D-glucosamine 2-epimerase
MQKKTKRKIAVFTGNRAEYGLLYPILKAIANHSDLEYFLIISGSHLSNEFGSTIDEIERDGFSIFAEVKLEMESKTVAVTSKAIGSGILNLSCVLEDLNPDFLIVYGDRFEAFAAAITGSQMNIPIGHIEGGDITEGGALDDSVRHAMTKLSHLHFTTNEQAAERVLKLGEEPWRVHNVGFPAIDVIKDNNFASLDELVEEFGITVQKPIILFTQHSVSTEYTDAVQQIRPSLKALNDLAERDCQVIITYPNNDIGGERVIQEISDYGLNNNKNIQIHKSLGRYNYHGILNVCGRKGFGVCVGNSSSGIKETPVFGCPSVNIGSRQKGRLHSTNVIHVDYDTRQILEACHKAIYDKEFRDICRNCYNPYGEGDTGKRISEILNKTKIDFKLIQKKMTY